MTREEFIAGHMRTCTATVGCRKYDAEKCRSSRHSLLYTKRKCAKKIWRDMKRRGTA